jgi:hypothetical protein
MPISIHPTYNISQTKILFLDNDEYPDMAKDCGQNSPKTWG